LSLFNELKRRNVFRIGIAYGITAWLIAQIAGLEAWKAMPKPEEKQ